MKKTLALLGVLSVIATPVMAQSNGSSSESYNGSRGSRTSDSNAALGVDVDTGVNYSSSRQNSNRTMNTSNSRSQNSMDNTSDSARNGTAQTRDFSYNNHTGTDLDTNRFKQARAERQAARAQDSNSNSGSSGSSGSASRSGLLSGLRR